MKFIDAIGLKYFYDKLKDKFVQRITYNKKTSVDDASHTDIERAIETPLIIGGKANSSSANTSLVLQDGNSSFEDETGNYIKIGGENIYIKSDNVGINALHIEKNIDGHCLNWVGNKTSISTDTFYAIVGGVGEINMTKSVTPYNILISTQGTNDDNYIKLATMKCICYISDGTNSTDDGLKINMGKNLSDKYYNFSSTEARLLKDVITASKTQIRNRLSSTCSTKLTEAKGFQVFTNLYADPEHCTDIADITDAEKNLMANYSVQWWILNTFRAVSKAVQLGSDNKIAPAYLPENYYQLTAREIPSSSWKTSTPFNILDGVVTNIYIGETVGNYTKWILIPYADTENQKYTAYKKGNANYIYSNYAFDPSQPLLPWEFWLPSNLAVNTVEVDW